MLDTGFQTHVNAMLRTGDDGRDFLSGIDSIKRTFDETFAKAKTPAKNISIVCMPRSAQDQVCDITVSASARDPVKFELTRRLVISCYERVGDPALLREIQRVVYQLTA